MVGLRLGLGKSLFPVGRAKDQRLPAGPIATAAALAIKDEMESSYCCHSESELWGKVLITNQRRPPIKKITT